MHTLQYRSSKWIIHICSTVERGKKRKGESEEVNLKKKKKGCRRNEARKKKRGKVSNARHSVRKESQPSTQRDQRRSWEKLISLFLRAWKTPHKWAMAKTEGRRRKNPKGDQSSSHIVIWPPPPPPLPCSISTADGPIRKRVCLRNTQECFVLPSGNCHRHSGGGKCLRGEVSCDGSDLRGLHPLSRVGLKN